METVVQKGALRKNRLWKRLLKGSLFIVLILIIFDITLLFYLGFFNIKNVSFQSSDTDCLSGASVKQESGLLGKNILFINEENVIDSLKSKYSCIKSIKLYKRFPQEISIDISQRQALVRLVALDSEDASPSASFLVDAEGVIFSQSSKDSSEPKLVILNQNLKVGDKVSGDVLKNALRFLEALKKMEIQSKEAKIYSSNILETTSMPKIYIDLEKNFEAKLASLQLIIAQAKIDDSQIEFVDLKFENPVIKYVPKKK